MYKIKTNASAENFEAGRTVVTAFCRKEQEDPSNHKFNICAEDFANTSAQESKTLTTKMVPIRE